jgi:hypothetical protein
MAHFNSPDQSMSSTLRTVDSETEDLNTEILACENKVYATFLGPKPNADALQELLLPDHLYIQFNGNIWTKEQNIRSLQGGVVFSSIEIKNAQVKTLSPTSAVIVARVLIKAASGDRDLSSETLTSTVWVKQGGKWLAQLHTSTAVTQG